MSDRLDNEELASIGSHLLATMAARPELSADRRQAVFEGVEAATVLIAMNNEDAAWKMFNLMAHPYRSLQHAGPSPIGHPLPPWSYTRRRGR